MSKEKISKSAHNQEITDRRKAERKLRRKGLFIESFMDIEELRAQRKERLKGVKIYRRDSVPEHSKKLFIIDSTECAQK